MRRAVWWRCGPGSSGTPGRTPRAVTPAWDEARMAGKSIGIACAAKNTGVGNGIPEFGRAVIRVDDDGGVTVFHSWTEMGQGVHTVLQQVACEELGLTPDRVRVAVDTSHELDAGQTTASRGTVLGGLGVVAASKELKAALNGGGLADLSGREFRGEVQMSPTY